jgi:hypothetical protein
VPLRERGSELINSSIVLGLFIGVNNADQFKPQTREPHITQSEPGIKGSYTGSDKYASAQHKEICRKLKSSIKAGGDEDKHKAFNDECGKEYELMNKKVEIKKQYGDWTVIKDLGMIKTGKRTNHYVLAICKCGQEKKLRFTNLTTKESTKCKNCAKKTHGKRYSSEYRSWCSLKQRCLNPNTINYDNYGARGITVCDRWLNSFENFYADMGPKPTPEHSIDRIDNDGNYEPGNCRWALQSIQTHNTRKKIKKYASIYKGVCYNKKYKKNWYARIFKNGECQYLGSFTNEIEAAKAYDKKAIELFGEFAKLNFKEG